MENQNRADQNITIIRKARPKDAKRISTLRRQTLEKININDYPRLAIDFLKKKNSSKYILESLKKRKVFVLINKNKILGCIEINLQTGKVGGLYIDYRYLRQGYGLKLMQFIEKFAQSKKIKKIKLHPTKTAYTFYKKLGYKVIKRNIWKGPGFKAKSIDMEKKLINISK
jgi:N-acetylglutamate synthase-like GNAT family acetyltransferase